MININENYNEQFQAEVLNYQGVVLVDFWAQWCGPCRAIAPVLEKHQNNTPDLKIVKVEVENDEAKNLARDYKVSSIPTLILFKNGQEIKRKVGSLSLTQIEEMTKPYF